MPRKKKQTSDQEGLLYTGYDDDEVNKIINDDTKSYNQKITELMEHDFPPDYKDNCFVDKQVDLLKDVPYINNHDELAEYLKPIYIINNYLKDDAEYTIFMVKLLNLLRGSFVIRQCREYPVRFKFRKNDKKEYTLQLRHFFINMILWEPFIEIYELDVLNESFIMDCEKNIPNIEDYINYQIIQVLRDYHVKPTIINHSISKVLYNLRTISIDFSQIMGLNFTLKTFIDKYNDEPRMKELMECTFDKEMQPYEVEQILNQYEKEELDIFMRDKKNPIGVILRSGQGIKHKQLVEMTVAQGYNPTITGDTIPIGVENSTMIKGANTPAYYYISAIASRKSLNIIILYSLREI